MNYGYDAQGNRVAPDDAHVDETARVHTVQDGEDEHALDGDDAFHRENHADGQHAGPSRAGNEDSASDFSDDVELVIGETGNQALDQPLVESTNINLGGRHRTETEAFLQLTTAPKGSGADSPVLMIGDKKDRREEQRRTQTFLDAVAKVPSRVRAVALAGTLHHGKTSLLTMLLGGTAYTPREDEEDRAISLKTHVVSALVRGAQVHQTSELLTLVDTPGHPDFIGEVAAGVRLADAALFCVDVVESLDAHGERLLRHIVLTERLPVVLVVTKVDRLILDLKLPPLDAYRKLRMVVEAVNNVIASCGTDSAAFLVAPENGTVLFSSTKLGFIFSLETFALKYAAMYPGGELDPACLAQRLWGRLTFDQGTFKKIANFRQRPSFVTFVLEPLYKVVAHSVTGKGAEMLSGQLNKLPRSPLTAMQEAVRLFLGEPSGEGVDALLSVLPTTQARTQDLCRAYQLDRPDSQAIFRCPTAASSCSSTPPCGVRLAAIAPLVCVFTATADISGSAARKNRKHHRTAMVFRVLAGTLRPNPHGAAAKSGKEKSHGPAGDRAPSPYIVKDELSDDVNPFSELRLTKLFVRMAGSGFVEVDAAYPGQVVFATSAEDEDGAGELSAASRHLVLAGGCAVEALLSLENPASRLDSTGAIDEKEEEEEEETANLAALTEEWLRGVRPWPFSYGHEPMVHVSLELKEPRALATFQRGLDMLRRTTPGLGLRTEERGEYTMTGFGELQLDTALHQLRTSLCAGVSIGLSQPFVSFSETVVDEEGVLAVVGTKRKGTLGCTSGAMPRSLTAAIEYEALNLFPNDKDGAGAAGAQTVKLWTTMRRDYGFDALDARHVVALGPDRTRGPSLLIDDTLEEERSQALTAAQHNAVIAGFRDAMRAGPLAGETVRGVAVKLVFAEGAADRSVRVNEIRANARTVVRHALFGARPRLLEPVLAADILCPAESHEKIGEILRQRRGVVLGAEAVAATTLTRLRALVPAMDSFGLETQIRMLTYGQAFPMFCFSQWDIVPGDPYDATIHVGPLEPAKGYQLARDFVLKTRFRKGLPMELTSDI